MKCPLSKHIILLLTAVTSGPIVAAESSLSEAQYGAQNKLSQLTADNVMTWSADQS